MVYISYTKLSALSIVCNNALTHSICVLHHFTEPPEICFDRTIYEVNEAAGQVEVCVILTSPDTSILESVLGVEVFEDERKRANEHFPKGAAIASEFLLTQVVIIFTFTFRHL